MTAPAESDTDEVMAAAVDVMHSWRNLDPYAPSTMRPLLDAEERWSELMRAWMTARGIEL